MIHRAPPRPRWALLDRLPAAPSWRSRRARLRRALLDALGITATALVLILVAAVIAALAAPHPPPPAPPKSKRAITR